MAELLSDKTWIWKLVSSGSHFASSKRRSFAYVDNTMERKASTEFSVVPVALMCSPLGRWVLPRAMPGDLDPEGPFWVLVSCEVPVNTLAFGSCGFSS